MDERGRVNGCAAISTRFPLVPVLCSCGRAHAKGREALGGSGRKDRGRPHTHTCAHGGSISVAGAAQRGSRARRLTG